MSATLAEPFRTPDPAPPPRRAPADAVRLLELEPELGDGIPPEQLAEARRRVVAPLVHVEAGGFDPAALAAGARGPAAPFAALVVDGLLTRTCHLGGRTTTQLLGPGDVLPLLAPDEPLSGADGFLCRAAAASRLAVLDARFLAAAQRWPWLTARLVERTARWADLALEHQAISQLPRVEARIVSLLWSLAERWGRVGPDGVVVPLTLTHEAIGTLVGAQRPTVSLALRELGEAGAVSRHGGAWLLAHASRELVATAAAPAHVATASLRVIPRAALPDDARALAPAGAVRLPEVLEEALQHR